MQHSTLVSLPPELIRECLLPLGKADLARAEASCRQLKAVAGGLLADWRATPLTQRGPEAPAIVKLLGYARSFKKELSQPVTDYVWHMALARAKYLKKDLGIYHTARSSKNQRVLELCSPGSSAALLVGFYISRPGTLTEVHLEWDDCLPGMPAGSIRLVMKLDCGTGAWKVDGSGTYPQGGTPLDLTARMAPAMVQLISQMTPRYTAQIGDFYLDEATDEDLMED